MIGWPVFDAKEVMRTFLITAGLLVAAAAGWFAGSRTADTQRADTSTEDSLVPAGSSSGNVYGIGRLEPRTGIIRIFAPSGQRIESMGDFRIGDPVKNDQPLFVVSGRTLREMELQMAEARKADAENQLQFEKSQGLLKKEAAQLALQETQAARTKIDSQRSGLSLLREQHDAAVSQLKRLQSLRESELTRKLVGIADIDRQQLLVLQLETQISQAEVEIELALKQANRAEQAARIDLETVGIVVEQSGLAVPKKSLDRAIEAAHEAWEMTEIRSPAAATVLDIVVRTGDTATNQPVMLLGNTDTMVCVAEINEAKMSDVRDQARATISSPAFDEPLTGTVISKGIMIGPPSMTDPNPFASVDRKTGRVVIELDSNSPAKDFVNLQVEVEIEASPRPPTAD